MSEKSVSLDDCSKATFWSKDKHNAFVTYTTDKNTNLMGVENDDIILATADVKDEAVIADKLDKHGYKSEDIDDNFLKRSLDKIKTRWEKAGSSSYQDKESAVSKATIGGFYTMAGTMVGSMLVSVGSLGLHAQRAAIELEAKSHPFLADLVSGKGGISSVCRSYISNHPDAPFGTVALAAAGVCVASYVGIKTIDKASEKVQDHLRKEDDRDRANGYKKSLGRYYISDPSHFDETENKYIKDRWVPVSKEVYDVFTQLPQEDRQHLGYRAFEKHEIDVNTISNVKDRSKDIPLRTVNRNKPAEQKRGFEFDGMPADGFSFESQECET